MRTITTSVYTFDELSAKAKERAREWYRQVFDFDGRDLLDNYADTADMFGLDIRRRQARLMNGTTRLAPSIYYSGFYSQGSGASFEGHYDYKKGALAAIKAEWPADAELIRIVTALADVQQRNFYQITVQIRQSGHYVHSHTMTFDIEREDGIEVSQEDDATICDALRDFADWMYDGLREAYEWETSDEVIDENIRANEYEFTENGEVA